MAPEEREVRTNAALALASMKAAMTEGDNGTAHKVRPVVTLTHMLLMHHLTEPPAYVQVSKRTLLVRRNNAERTKLAHCCILFWGIPV